MKSSLSAQYCRSRRGRIGRRLLVALFTLAVGAGTVFWLTRLRTEPGVRAGKPALPASGSAVERHEAGALRAVAQTEPERENPRAAQIVFGGARRAVVPNVRGEFPRVSVPAAAVIVATVPFPGVAPGATVFLQAEDGGVLGGEAAGGAVIVGEDHRVTLEFRATATEGVQRVMLRHGTETRLLEFWVGPEAPVLVRNGE